MNSSTKKGRFVVIEGGEGVGKSTNMQFVQDYLHQQGVTFQTSREPGGTELAEQIRNLIVSHHRESMDPMTELLLVFAARAQHLTQKIRPVINSGQWLVCDRFTDATYAYQGGGRQLDKTVIRQLEQIVQADLRPDCVIILDAPVELGRQRASQRAELDRLEAENLAFHQRVRDAYLERAAQYPDRYKVIDAARPLADVQQAIGCVLHQQLEHWHNE